MKTGPAPRLVRGSLILAGALLVAALVATGLSTHRSIAAAGLLLRRGQGTSLLRAIADRLRESHGPPSRTVMEGVLALYRESGLRYVGVVRPEIGLIAEAGEPTGYLPDVLLEPDAPEEGAEVKGERILVWGPLGPPPRPPPPPRSPHSRPRPPPPHHPGGGPRLVLEFVPQLALELESSARRTLGAGAAAALALVVATLLILRWLLERDAAALREAQESRLRTLGEMSSVLAHEIRNPLASLKGHAQLLEETLGPGKSRDKVARVIEEARRLERLTTDLLDYVRAGSVEPRASDPTALTREAAELAGLEKDVVDGRSAPASWPLDPDRFRQIMVNLLENARLASPQDRPPAVRIEQHRDQLCVEVRDHGEGLPQGDPELLFEPFHTRRTRGTGLGLAVVRRLVEAHGGTVEATDHPDGGALFRVELPAETPREEQS